jgi:hypothetical protein
MIYSVKIGMSGKVTIRGLQNPFRKPQCGGINLNVLALPAQLIFALPRISNSGSPLTAQRFAMCLIGDGVKSFPEFNPESVMFENLNTSVGL